MSADENSGSIPPSDEPGYADEPGDGLDAEFSDDWSDDAEVDRRSRIARGIGAAIVLVIIVVLALLLLRGCGTFARGGSVGEKTITPVPTQVRAENAVSVWVKPGATVQQVLAASRVRTTSMRSMGEGLYFVFLPDGESAAAIVARLKNDDRVYDAGFVYDELKVEPFKSSKP